MWAKYLHADVIHVKSFKDYLSMFLESKGNDLIIYRYQNNPSKLLPSLAILSIISLQLLKARLLGIKVVWICHNVDKETAGHFRWIESLRRSLLDKCAMVILVLDRTFVLSYKGDRSKVRVISFGSKARGTIDPRNYAMISEFSKKFEFVVLVVGQDGGKYKNFSRVPFICLKLLEKGISPGFVLVGADKSRAYENCIETRVLRINEPNLDETSLKKFVRCMYKENEDISMPFTVYAAASAGIPMVTWSGNCIEPIIIREKIGMNIEDFISGEGDHIFEFDRFLKEHNWASLSNVLHEEGVIQ